MLELDLLAGCLRRGSSEERLRQKTFLVLVHLLQSGGRLVTKDELLTTLWPGIVVTEDVLTQSIGEIRKALGDDPKSPSYILTVRGAGYRFVGSVSGVSGPAPSAVEYEELTAVEVEIEERVAVAARGSPAPALPAAGRSRRGGILAAVAALVLLATALGSWAVARARTEARPSGRSLFVLPFESRGNDTELAWMREGLADMLVADLSRMEGLTVLSRQQLRELLARRPGSGPVGLRAAIEVARSRKVDAFLLGAFASVGGRLRLDVQVHEGGSGRLVSAESLTVETPADVLLGIDGLAARLASRLGARLAAGTGLAGARTASLQAYRLYSLALEKAEAYHNTEALELLGEAVAIDPSFAMAHARIGYVHVIAMGQATAARPHLETAYRLADRLTERERLSIEAWYSLASFDFDAAIRALRSLVDLDPRDIESAVRLANLLRGEDRQDEAAAVLEATRELDPGAPAVANTLAGVYSELGRHREAIASAERYVDLEPDEPNAHDSVGLALQWAGRYDEAISAYRRALELGPGFEIARVHLGNVFFQLGRRREALENFEAYRKLVATDADRARADGCIALVHYRQRNFAAAWEASLRKLGAGRDRLSEEVLIALDRGDRAAAERLLRENSFEPATLDRGRRPARRAALAMRGAVDLRMGRTEEALAALRQAVRHRPLIYSIDHFEGCLAEALISLRRWDEAIAECERILSINPREPMALYRSGVAHAEKGEGGRARAAFTRFLEVWKDADADAPELVDARRRLRSL